MKDSKFKLHSSIPWVIPTSPIKEYVGERQGHNFTLMVLGIAWKDHKTKKFLRGERRIKFHSVIKSGTLRCIGHITRGAGGNLEQVIFLRLNRREEIG